MTNTKKIFPIFFICVAILAVCFFVLVYFKKPNVETGKIFDAWAIQSSQIVAGKPVEWVVVLDKKNITDDQRFLQLPKKAKNVEIKNTNDNQKEAFLNSAKKLAILDKDRKSLSKSQTSVLTAGLLYPVKSFLLETFFNIKDFVNFKLVEKDGNKFYDISQESQKDAEYIEVRYQTEAPEIIEKKINDGKKIVVSADDELGYTNILAYTNVPEMFELRDKKNIKVKNYDGDIYVEFEAYDLNNNGKIDYIEWSVPHLSTQTYEVTYIYVTRALRLDKDKNVIEDIYSLVREKDNVWASLLDGQYIRATFETVLDSTKDNTIYVRPTDGGSASYIEVYPVYADSAGNQIEGSLLGTFKNIDHEGTYKILLTDLEKPTDVFDFKIIGNIEVDWVVDPDPADAYWVGGDGNWSDATNHWATTSGGTPDAGNLPGATTNIHFDSNSGGGTCTVNSSVSVASFIMDTSNTTAVTLSSNFVTTNNFTITAGTFTTAQGATSNVTVGGTLLVDTNGIFIVRYSSISGSGAGQTITAASVTINGNMNANGQGFPVGLGPGKGSAPVWNIATGAGYGGIGGAASSSSYRGASPYGTAASPVSLGSGGVTNYHGVGGSGGGSIKLIVTNALTVSGDLSANGSNATVATGYSSGLGTGGSGGSIWIIADTLLGSGTIQAKGGVSIIAGSTMAGGSGGGRIDVSNLTVIGSTFFTAGGTFDISGSVSPQNLSQDGSAGTIKFPSNFDLVIDNSGATGLKNLTLGSNVESGLVDETLYTFNSVVVKSSSTLTLSGNPQIINGGTASEPYGQGVTITASNINIELTGSVSALGQGFAGKSSSNTYIEGKGTGTQGGSGISVSGSGHGGEGGMANKTTTPILGGTTYGSITAPTELGSGGGTYVSADGRGGGAIKLVVSETLTVNGSINANGENGPSKYGSAGGSGGSIYINVNILTGSGTISADGGSGYGYNSSYNGGGSGGGRISIIYYTSCSIAPTAIGGVAIASTYAESGSAGTVYIESSSDGSGNGSLIIDNNSITTTATTKINASVTDTAVGNVDIQNLGNLEIADSSVSLVVSGSWDNSATQTLTDGAVIFDSTGDETITAGGDSFYNVTFNGTGGSWAFQDTQDINGAMTVTNGSIDFNGQTFDIASNLTMGAGSQIISDANAMNSSSISVGGDLSLTGEVGDILTFNATSSWSLSVTGSASATYVAVAYSDASGGTEIDASGGTNIDNDNNTNWDFGSPIADSYWVGSTGNWSDATNHWAASSNGSPGAANIPVTTTNVHFDSNSGTGTVTIDVDSIGVANFDESSTNITISTTSYGVTVTGDTVINKTISGTNAITFSGTDKTITGGSGGTISSPVVLGANQIIDIATGTLTISGIISDGGSAYGISKTGAGQLTLSGANTFSGGLTIKSGTASIETSTTAAGTGTITIGDTSGSADATLLSYIQTPGADNSIVVASGSTGTSSISAPTIWAPRFNGTITLNKDVTFDCSGTGALSALGVISGGYSVTKIGTGELTLGGANTFTGGLVIKAGTLKSQNSGSTWAFGGSGTGTITLGDTSGSSDATLAPYNGTFENPITVSSGSSGTLSFLAFGANGSVTLSGATTLNNNLTLSSTQTNSNYIFTLSGGVSGSGDITISANSSGKITISSEAPNFTGSITNSGTGAGTTTISAVIGSNVTGLTQNSSTSKLLLSGNNSTISGDVAITSGTLELSGTTNLNVAGNFSNSDTFTPNSGKITLTSGTHEIAGATTFYDLTLSPNNTITFPASTTQTISNTFSCTGTAGNIITINSSSAGTQATLSKSSGTVDCDYLSLQDSNATGGATWNAGNNSTAVSNVTGWLGLVEAPTSSVLKFIGKLKFGGKIIFPFLQ